MSLDDVPYRKNVKEMLNELSSIVAKVLSEKTAIDSAIANEIGVATALQLVRNWGGSCVYIPTSLVTDEWHWELYLKFDGHNIDELARKYKISQQWAYTIIKRMKALDFARRQLDLFTEESTNNDDEDGPEKP